jgi:hypothetical protein
MSGLLDKLERWRETEWPSNPGEQHTDSEGAVHREQFILKTDYWSTKILLTQPCLSRLGRRVENQSDNSAKFDLDAAEACVTAALEIARLLPDQPDARLIYTTGPWWAIVHISECLHSMEQVIYTDLTINISSHTVYVCTSPRYDVQLPRQEGGEFRCNRINQEANALVEGFAGERCCSCSGICCCSGYLRIICSNDPDQG